jgi:hypothetical protein
MMRARLVSAISPLREKPERTGYMATGTSIRTDREGYRPTGGPERLGLGGADIHAENLAPAVTVDAEPR